MASHFNQANHSGKSILARAARLFYSRRRGRRTNMILYSLLFIGNTAQFPPYGLSTAPAAAARHLRSPLQHPVLSALLA